MHEVKLYLRNVRYYFIHSMKCKLKHDDMLKYIFFILRNIIYD